MMRFVVLIYRNPFFRNRELMPCSRANFGSRPKVILIELSWLVSQSKQFNLEVSYPNDSKFG